MQVENVYDKQAVPKTFLQTSQNIILEELFPI